MLFIIMLLHRSLFSVSQFHNKFPTQPEFPTVRKKEREREREMVLIHIKNSDENQFLFETTTKDSVDKLVRELVRFFFFTLLESSVE